MNPIDAAIANILTTAQDINARLDRLAAVPAIPKPRHLTLVADDADGEAGE